MSKESEETTQAIRSNLASIVKSAQNIKSLVRDLPHNKGLLVKRLGKHKDNTLHDYITATLYREDIDGMYTDKEGNVYSISVIVSKRA